MHSVSSICLQLKEHEMKTTVDAISKVLEISPKQVTSGKKSKYHLYSCIIDPSEINSENKDSIITDYRELEVWLEKEENQSTASKEMLFLVEHMIN